MSRETKLPQADDAPAPVIASAASAESAGATEPAAPAKRPFPWRLGLELLMGAGLILLLVLLLARPGKTAPAESVPAEPSAAEETAVPAETAAPAPTAEPGKITLRFYSPAGNSRKTVPAGEALDLPVEELEGYTFLGWRDAEGRAFASEGLRLWEDTELYAAYAMALGRREHTPYLSLDADGAFHPGATVTRREVAQMLYAQLDTELVGDGRFLDVGEDDPCYEAVATLKSLGMLSGSRFHPDAEITRRELLCPFFPAGQEALPFSDLTGSDPAYPLFCTAAERGWIESGEDVAARPDEPLTRRELVGVMSQALDLRGDSEQRWELVGTILDVAHTDPLYWAIAEAAIPHSHSGQGERERWLDSEALPIREEGLFFLGVKLHAIDAEGDPVCDGDYAGLHFGPDGVETSGMPELDEKIWALLEAQVDPAKSTPEQMLRDLFYYEVVYFRYRMGNYYPVDEPSGWEAQEAYDMLERRAGNCYSFAALYCELARALGFDAHAHTGAVLGTPPNDDLIVDVHGKYLHMPDGHVPHGWVEIVFDDVPYIFDTEMAYRYRLRSQTFEVFFKMGDFDRARFGYYPSDRPVPTLEPWQIEANQAAEAAKAQGGEGGGTGGDGGGTGETGGAPAPDPTPAPAPDPDPAADPAP